MAEMIGADGFRAAMAGLEGAWGEAAVPVLYVNSTAEVKALAGEADGICCTSSNAATIVRRVLDRGRRVFFVPDENLGLNVAASLGVPAETWPPAGDDAALGEARMAVWRGFCPIHERMLAHDVERARSAFPGCRVVVHPECAPEVVRLSDATGSTSRLLKEAESAPPGSTLVIGTESTFVSWIAARHPGVRIVPLRASTCPNMAKITTGKLRATLEDVSIRGARGGSIPEELFVPEGVQQGARRALERMIEYAEGG